MKTAEFISALRKMLEEYDGEGEEVKETEEVEEVKETEETEPATEEVKEVVRTETETVTVDKESGERTIESKITFKDGEYYGI